MTTKCIDTLHTEHLELLEFKQNSYSVTNCSINPLLHLHIAFPPQQYIVSNTYKLHKHSPLTPQYYRWHTSQTQSTQSPVWMTHQEEAMCATAFEMHMCGNSIIDSI